MACAIAFSALSFARSVATLTLKLWLVVGVGWGLTGFMLADLVVTIALLPWLWPWTRSLLRPVFSFAELRQCLRFGLPRLPRLMFHKGVK